MCRADCVRKRGRKGEREREYMRACVRVCVRACVRVCASGRLNETVFVLRFPTHNNMHPSLKMWHNYYRHPSTERAGVSNFVTN